MLVGDVVGLALFTSTMLPLFDTPVRAGGRHTSHFLWNIRTYAIKFLYLALFSSFRKSSKLFLMQKYTFFLVSLFTPVSADVGSSYYDAS